MKYFISYGTYFIILIIILQFIYLDEQRKQLHTKNTQTQTNVNTNTTNIQQHTNTK